MPTDDDFLRELRSTFVIEAREHLQTVSQGLLDMEAAGDGAARGALLETVFRAAHSLKGAARAVDLGDVESVCQLLEDVLARQRREPGVLPADAGDVLHRALDAIAARVSDLAGMPPTLKPAELTTVRRELRRLAASTAQPTAEPSIAAVSGVNPPPLESPPAPAPAEPAIAAALPVAAADSTVRVALPKLEAQLQKTEELLVAKLATGQHLAELRELGAWFDTWRRSWAGIEGDARRLRRQPASAGQEAAAQAIARLLDFFEWGDGAVRSLESRLADIGRVARQDHESVNRAVDGALDNAKLLLLLPFSTLCATFPKLVRDLCRAEGKEADLVISGEQVELDKRILEEIKDPLVHMLRNAVDHAVEPPAERLARGKPRRATISLAVVLAEGNRVQITLADDGAGIATERVRAAAVRQGFIGAEEAAQLDEAAVHRLIFRSSLSTGLSVTPLSGRGLGMAIVQEHAQRLGGEVEVESRPGQGTRFRIVVPALRATFRGILCEAAERQFIMPAAMVERVARLGPEALRNVEGRRAVCIGERVIALVQLADVLELPPGTQPERAELQVIVVGNGSSSGSGNGSAQGSDSAIAFAVDAVLEEREVMIKPLGKPLVRVRNVAAAAVLGSGVLVPVLHAADLLKSARLAPSRGPRAVAAKPPRAGAKTILVAEDSITSRLLLKTILQAAGYAVKTAVDGAEALALLRTEPFDLLVSDVEMPRLNGFDLTARLRSDKKLAELPVVLVTALATREDRERGIDVGADAYIVKGSFDQDKLLEAIERLVG